MERLPQTSFPWLGGRSGERPGRAPAGLVTVSMRCMERGMTLGADARAQVGRAALKNWRARFSEDPGVAFEAADGKTVSVTAFPREHVASSVDPALDVIAAQAAARAKLAGGKLDKKSTLELVEQGFGIALREHQREALTQLCAGKDVIVHAPTGSGKSVIFQGAARILGQKGLTVVVYPLRALVEDQRLGA